MIKNPYEITIKEYGAVNRTAHLFSRGLNFDEYKKKFDK